MDIASRVPPTHVVQHRRHVIAAIDFGTTFTGYAISFKGGDKKTLTGKHGGIWEDHREPTCLLLNRDKSFNSFGYKAQRTYSKFRPEERSDYFFFENFKMDLYHSQRLTRDLELRDVKGKTAPALDVFKLVIVYITKSVFRSIQTSVDVQNQSNTLSNDDLPFMVPQNISIQWMLSIPAIWPDAARQFMREAALCAGIPGGSLRLVLEPEAASLFCRQQRMNIVGTAVESLPVGHKYILADLGGGTIDICAHEILPGGKLRELYRASGDSYGGSLVDRKFYEFMINLIGKQAWIEFQDKYMATYLGLMRSFEHHKVVFSGIDDDLHIDLGPNLISLHEQYKTSDVFFEEVIARSEFADDIDYDPETLELTISTKVMKTFFQPSLEGIIKKLNEVYRACENGVIENILLVGGFSESSYVRENVERAFESVRVVKDQDASLAVLKGSIMMGYQPKNIIQRRARFSYGFASCKRFIEGEHPVHLKFVRDNQVLCRSIFKRLIQKGQLVEYEDKFSIRTTSYFRLLESKMETLKTALYRSYSENPQYCTDEGCSEVGQIVLCPPPNGWPDKLDGEDMLIVGETEFLVKAFNRTTREEFEAQMDFL